MYRNADEWESLLTFIPLFQCTQNSISYFEMNLNQLTNNWGKINRWDYLADSRWNYEDITYILDPKNIEKMKHDILGNSGDV